MAQNDFLNEEKIRNAFKNVKIDINRLNNELIGIKSELNIIKSNIIDFKEELSKIIVNFEEKRQNFTNFNEEISIGNNGVLNKQTNKQTDKQTNTQQFDQLNELQNDVKEQFKRLTKQEFLTFLTIYQLEEELEIVRYSDIAKRLNLSETSIRVYVTRLIQKNIPILKNRVNNKVINLSLLPEFRKLGLKNPLTRMYYNLDPLQRRLSDEY